jgi:multicomponent Na+:H+ antiporter subunit C
MASSILGNVNYWLATLLLLIGVYGMLMKPNLIKKLMAMNMMQVAAIMFYISLAAKTGGTPPIEIHGLTDVQAYVNPLPHALMLTAIVVGVSTTGVALALLIRIYGYYGTLEEPEILERMRE